MTSIQSMLSFFHPQNGIVRDKVEAQMQQRKTKRSPKDPFTQSYVEASQPRSKRQALADLSLNEHLATTNGKKVLKLF
jgi:hypothetical protein